MKYSQLVEFLNKTPEGVALEKRQVRATTLLALAVSIKVPMTPTPMSPSQLSEYFFTNTSEVSKQLFEINECFPINVDRAIEVASNIYARRHNIAFQPTTYDLVGGFGDLSTFLPELPELNITTGDISLVSEFIDCGSVE